MFKSWTHVEILVCGPQQGKPSDSPRRFTPRETSCGRKILLLHGPTKHRSRQGSIKVTFRQQIYGSFIEENLNLRAERLLHLYLTSRSWTFFWYKTLGITWKLSTSVSVESISKHVPLRDISFHPPKTHKSASGTWFQQIPNNFHVTLLVDQFVWRCASVYVNGHLCGMNFKNTFRSQIWTSLGRKLSNLQAELVFDRYPTTST